VDAFLPAGYANATLTIPKDLLLQELAIRFPEAPAEWLGKGAGLRIPEPSRHRIGSLLGRRLELDRTDPSWLAGSEACRHFEEDLIGAFAEALRGSWDLPHPTVTVQVRKRYGALRLIRDHIADHRGALLRLDALCEVSGMSRRGLEYLFKDHFGIGVNAFVRCQRLHGARRAIRDSAPEPGVVKRIALEWGFWHLGRFAHDYQACFGESPSATLSRQRRSATADVM